MDAESESAFDKINNERMSLVSKSYQLRSENKELLKEEKERLSFLNDEVERLSPNVDAEYKKFLKQFWIDLRKLGSDIDPLAD
jgi:hypothetical protein